MNNNTTNIPVSDGELLPNPSWADSEAKEEDKNWKSLYKIKEKNDGNWLKVYGWIVIIITCVFTAIFMATLIIWIFHYLSPENLHWLNPDQLNKIQSILFSGGMGAVVSGIVRTQINKAQ